MDIERYITREDFLKLRSYSDGGTLIDGRRYAAISSGKLSLQNQLKDLGKVDKTGEGTIDRVFFFEVIRDSVKESWDGDNGILFQIVSAKVVDRYKYICAQEAEKEIALIRAKITLRDKEIEKENRKEGNNNEHLC